MQREIQILPWRRRAMSRALSKATAPASKLDLYLVRAGYIAQVCALVATIAGFYYTVIPLYQKAAVDEQLAKREAELKTVEERLTSAKREAYELARGQFIERLARAGADTCAELRKAITQPSPDESQESRHKRLVSIKTVPSTCLHNVATKLETGIHLTEADAGALAALVEDVGRQLDARRTAALVEVDQLGRSGAQHPERLDPPGTYVAQAEAFQDRAAKLLGRPLSADVLQKRVTAALARTQERVAQDYRVTVSNTVLSRFRGFKWPAA